jgi:hypothetical protein
MLGDFAADSRAGTRYENRFRGGGRCGSLREGAQRRCRRDQTQNPRAQSKRYAFHNSTS